MVFKGVCTALVTPFNQENQIDYERAKRLIDFQLENKVDAILILGSTGEGFSLSREERVRFIDFVRGETKGRCPLIVGAGSNNVDEAIKSINEAKEHGADACLVQTPYFNKCTKQGVFEFFKKIASETDISLIVYNVPSRSGVNLEPQTMEKLCALKNIAGLKEANGDINHVLSMFNRVGGKVPIYCGNDNLNNVFFSLGASGTISVTSNIYPSVISQMFYDEGVRNDCHNRLFAFNNLMFVEPNPIPVKYALSKKGLIENNLRLPLTRLEKAHAELIDAAMEEIK